jgi:hypothetical protein
MRGLYEHIPTSKLVFISEGEDEIDGRISNFYSGNVVNKNGELTNEILGDYNKHGKWVKIKDYKLKITNINQI